MKYTILIVAFLLVALGIWYVSPSGVVAPEASESPSATVSSAPIATPTPSATPTATQATAAFTVAQVAEHNSADSCFSIVRGGVYDLTAWIKNHPGGREAILKICGKDGTSAFEGVHDGKAAQEAQLVKLKIGIVTP